MSQPALVIPAATVLLLRDSPRGLEVFMVERHHEIDSFSGALVFPGGKVDAADRSEQLKSVCRDAEQYSADILTLRVAAIREAFEECGVLLARPQGETELVDAGRLDHLHEYRQKLLDNTINMFELCQHEQLELATDVLHHYAHWITPKFRPKQFDTHFFLAPAPTDQLALHDGSESKDSMWLTPKDALQSAAQGKLTIVFPTRMNLLKLDRSETLQQALTAAINTTVVTVQPEVEEKREDGNVMLIPQQADYGANRIFVGKDGIGFEFLS